jgi:hypothetical protein
MARGKNYYRSVIEPFFPHSQFSPPETVLYQIDVPALSYIYAAYGKSGLIS